MFRYKNSLLFRTISKKVYQLICVLIKYEITFGELVHLMVDSDLRFATNDNI